MADLKLILSYNKYKLILFGIVLISLILISFVILDYYHLSKMQVVTASDGNRYYLNKEKEYIIPDKGEELHLKLNFSSKMHKVYGKKEEDFSRNMHLKMINRTFSEDWYWHSLVNSSEEDAIIDLLIKNIESKIENGETAYVGKDAKALYAAKLVQNIPYDYLKYTLQDRGTKLPYETLYTQTGVCRESAPLLAKILAKMGYEVALVSIPAANHVVVGIKCPLDYENIANGYCIIESTGAVPIGKSNYKGGLWGYKELGPRDFTNYKISDGDTFNFSYSKR